MTMPEEILDKLKLFIYQQDEIAKKKQQYIQKEIIELALISEPISLAEIHVLDYIGSDPTLNVIGISKQMNMTRGAISKITARLERKGLVVKTQLPSNQKEVFFQLTPTGQKLWDLHRRDNQNKRNHFLNLFQGYSEAELSGIIHFLDDILREGSRILEADT
ncbi:MarR family transcriptional regulator [Brevibacillus centrosporus]|uniref:MarR family transcriptional regulator n=1 Tax=Brevibacillus centrosporus TaxID=54910 RepID=UPI00380EC207